MSGRITLVGEFGTKILSQLPLYGFLIFGDDRSFYLREVGCAIVSYSWWTDANICLGPYGGNGAERFRFGLWSRFRHRLVFGGFVIHSRRLLYADMEIPRIEPIDASSDEGSVWPIFDAGAVPVGRD